MTESRVKTALQLLAKDALERIAEVGEGLEPFRGGIALHDSERDGRFTALASFPQAVTVLEALPLVRVMYGSGTSTCLALQFIYALCDTLEQPAFDAKAFELVWTSFWDELSRTEWTYFGVSNLQNFHSEAAILDLGDGVSIRHRSFKELGRLLRWEERKLALLSQDWEQGAFRAHVLLLEHKAPRTPENFMAASHPILWTKAERALRALRLLKAGNVRIGRIFFSRPMEFNVGPAGLEASGFSVWHPGTVFHLEAPEVPSVRALYELLARFEAKHRRALHNIDLALRRFSSTYERYFYQAEDRIIDAITALEALLGESTEIAFKLAFRTSAILASDDDERVAIFSRMKAYYDTRNRIVHGAVLKQKHLQLIQKPDGLLNIVRRLLVGFLRLAESGPLQPESFQAELDGILQHSQRRAELRKQMGLTEA